MLEYHEVSMNEPPAASMPIIQQKCKNLGVALYRVQFKVIISKDKCSNIPLSVAKLFCERPILFSLQPLLVLFSTPSTISNRWYWMLHPLSMYHHNSIDNWLKPTSVSGEKPYWVISLILWTSCLSWKYIFKTSNSLIHSHQESNPWLLGNC